MLKFTSLLVTVCVVHCMPEALIPDIDNIDKNIEVNGVEYGKEAQTDIRSIMIMGMKQSDPIIVDRIVAHLATLNYTISDVTFTGLSKCTLKNTKINKNTLTLDFQWLCPKFRVEGQYQTNGTLIVISIEGHGDFEVRLGKYELIAKVKLEEFQDKNGQVHLKMKNFKIQAVNFLEPVTYRMDNLFNGDTGLAKEALKFINENWQDVSDIIKEPILYAWVKQALININVFLKQDPFEWKS